MSAWLAALTEVSWSIVVPAFCAGLLVIATHVPLGMQVLQRGIIFIDLAIAQVAGLGAYLVIRLYGEAASVLWVQAGAVGLALVAAWLLVATERITARYQEPVIGIVFVLAATAVVLLLANDPHGGQHLADLLAGQILWIGWAQIFYSALATAVLLCAMFFFQGKRLGFYSLFAVAITVSVQLAGVYLVFATLIIPALATAKLQARRMRLWATYLVAVVGYVLGLAGSALFDLPTGPLIVWSLALVGVATLLILRRKRHSQF
jgi:zinc/manganese transport system permease protein